MTVTQLEPMDLAALLCSRVCHDVISPVSAIVNGLEVLADENDPSMREIALDLIRKSANSASARLQFCRLAFGAAGSAGATIDTGDAEHALRGIVPAEKTKLDWRPTNRHAPKNQVKLLLNLSAVALNTISRGGELSVDIVGADENVEIHVVAKGNNCRLANGIADLIRGIPVDGLDARSIQAFYAGLVAREISLEVDVTATPEAVSFIARRKAASESEASAVISAPS